MKHNVHIDDYQGKHLHFIGIGGCSMSGLALMCANRGYKITGSDRSKSPFTQRIEDNKIAVTIGHSPENVRGADLVIYSAAIKPDNPERLEARRLGIPEIERSELLGQLSGQYAQVIGIAGCHGKTTITSMLALILIKAGIDPTVHVGGMVDFLGGGVKIGESPLFLTEACEYVDSYLELKPTCVLVNNIDNDHLDYFKDIEAIYQSFKKFVSLMPENGILFGSAEDERVIRLAKECSKYPFISYGLTTGDYTAQNIIACDDGHTHFEVFFRGEKLFPVQLSMPGNHNIQNALAAICVARHFGASDKCIIDALGEYTLTHRRFELYGKTDGVSIYHDYAHHPAEIRSCLQAARSICKGKLYAVFQCNSYTRARTLFCENVTCFCDADEVLVVDIYPGREQDTGIVHAKDMVKGIKLSGTTCRYLATFENVRNYLHQNWHKDDIVVTLGSGDVYIQTKKLF